jgi:hypothetical protein
MEDLSVPACTQQPPCNRGLSKAEDAFRRGRVQPFGQRRQHHGDLLRGHFQTIERRVASSAERGATRLTAKDRTRLHGRPPDDGERVPRQKKRSQVQGAVSLVYPDHRRGGAHLERVTATEKTLIGAIALLPMGEYSSCGGTQRKVSTVSLGVCFLLPGCRCAFGLVLQVS